MKGAASADASAIAEPMLAPLQPVEYRLADGAKAPASSAPAYKLVPGGDLTSRQVAAALALQGDEADGVEVEQGIGWFYAAGGQDGVVSSSSVGCAASTPAPVRSTPEDDACGDVPEPQPPAGVPTAAEAEARFREVLDRLGVDVTKGKVEGDLGGDDFARSVRFTPEVDGTLVPGLETTVTYGGEGRVEYAQGFSGRFEKLGDYPLVAMDEAFRRFQAGRGGIEPMVGRGDAVAEAVPADVPAKAPAADDGPTMTIEPQPDPLPVPLEPRIVEITGAELTFQLVYPFCEGGDYFLVPAYRLRPRLPAAEAGFAARPARAAPGDVDPAIPSSRRLPDGGPAAVRPTTSRSARPARRPARLRAGRPAADRPAAGRARRGSSSPVCASGSSSPAATVGSFLVPAYALSTETDGDLLVPRRPGRRRVRPPTTPEG